jgi:hypothetical protein
MYGMNPPQKNGNYEMRVFSGWNPSRETFIKKVPFTYSGGTASSESLTQSGAIYGEFKNVNINYGTGGLEPKYLTIGGFELTFAGDTRSYLPDISDIKLFVDGMQSGFDLSSFYYYFGLPEYIGGETQYSILLNQDSHEIHQSSAKVWFEFMCNGATIFTETIDFRADGTISLIPAPALSQNPMPFSVSHAITPATNQYEQGNTNGNIQNHGRATIKDGWIYYATDNAVHKMRTNRKKKTLLLSIYTHGINVIGEWVFINGLIRFRTDGTGLTQITEPSGDIIAVIGDWIYYKGYEPSGIFKIRTDGTEKTTIYQNNSSFPERVNISGDWIYFVEGAMGSNYRSLFRMRTDGTGKQTLSGQIYDLVVDDEWIYYTGATEGGIYKVHADGTDRGVKIINDMCSILNVSGKWIYFVDDNNNFIYRMKTDGTERTQVNNEPIDTYTGITVVGDWVIYRGLNDNLLYKIRTDGTGKQFL